MPLLDSWNELDRSRGAETTPAAALLEDAAT
jgi:hypothetical protein